MEMVTVHTSLNPADADLTRSRLDAAGFHPTITGLSAMSIEGYALTVGGILVKVPDTEAADALEFLKAGPGPSPE